LIDIDVLKLSNEEQDQSVSVDESLIEDNSKEKLDLKAYIRSNLGLDPKAGTP